MAQGDGKSFIGSLIHMKKSGMLWVVFLAAAVGVILLFWSNITGACDKKENTMQSDEKDMSMYEYEEKLKSEVRLACESVLGENTVKFVAVYFESSFEDVYAKDIQEYKDGQLKSEYVILGNGNNAHCLKISENLPKISGIGVVCRTNGENVKAQIVSLLSGIYGLPYNRIYISSP